jgi:uncharacterized protein (DUF983 family)
MNIIPGVSSPETYPREHDVCQRCPRCHPGKAYSVLFCKVENCVCHRRLT